MGTHHVKPPIPGPQPLTGEAINAHGAAADELRHLADQLVANTTPPASETAAPGDHQTAGGHGPDIAPDMSGSRGRTKTTFSLPSRLGRTSEERHTITVRLPGGGTVGHCQTATLTAPESAPEASSTGFCARRPAAATGRPCSPPEPYGEPTRPPAKSRPRTPIRGRNPGSSGSTGACHRSLSTPRGVYVRSGIYAMSGVCVMSTGLLPPDWSKGGARSAQEPA